MKDLKDWTAQLTDVGGLSDDGTHALYADMLATAHDIGYRVPDAQLVETEDASIIRGVIPALHEGIVKFHAEAKADAKTKAKQRAEKPAAAPKKKTADANAAKNRKPGKTAEQQPSESKESKMAATAKKAPAKKVAKKAAAKAPAKKTAKKAAKTNARTPVARNPFGENAKIKVLSKDTGVREDSERGKRIAVVFKYNGKPVSKFFSDEKPPYNRTDTLRFLIDRKFIEVK